MTIFFNLPDDDGEGFDVTYSIGGNTISLTAIVNGHTEQHTITSSTTATLLLVTNNDDDDDACFTVFSQTIPIVVSELDLTISNQTDPDCDQINGSITASVSNGFPPYLYSLNGGNPQSNSTFNGLGAGTYTVVVQDALGCTNQQTATLTTGQPPTVSITIQTNPGCGQSNGSITVEASGGTSPYQYSLDGGAFQNTNTFSSLGTGNYTVITQDAVGCTASVSATLTSPNAPTLTIINQTNPGCGQSNGSITTAASGGVTPYQYSLDGTVYQTSPTFNGLSAGSYQIFVQDAADCIQVETVELTNPGVNLPQANVSANTTQGCSSTIFTLTGNAPPGMTGLWTSAQTPPLTPTEPVWELSDLPPGSITATWTLSAPGCPNYDAFTVTIDILPPPIANTDGIFEVAQGDFVDANVLLNDVLPSLVDVRILKNPAQGTAFLNSQNILEYQPSAAADGLDTVVYEICYLDCPDVCDTALVLFRNLRDDNPCLITGDTSYVFTNGLTPNDDGNNDYLVFRAVSVEDCEVNYAKSEIIIYNRWGDIVFEASPYSNNWGGKNGNGDDLPPGVYYFVLRITLDKVYSQFGSVILLR